MHACLTRCGHETSLSSAATNCPPHTAHGQAPGIGCQDVGTAGEASLPLVDDKVSGQSVPRLQQDDAKHAYDTVLERVRAVEDASVRREMMRVFFNDANLR